jgi:hypothetical protein
MGGYHREAKMMDFSLETSVQNYPIYVRACQTARQDEVRSKEVLLDKITKEPRPQPFKGIARGFQPARPVTVHEALEEEREKDTYFQRANPSFANARKALRRHNAKVTDETSR